jgi:hypothetical protein
MRKPVVGQEVFLEPINDRARYGNATLLEGYVVKNVRRKYFDVWKDGSKESVKTFIIETWEEKSGIYYSDFVAYASKQDYLDVKEKEFLLHKMREVFGTLFGSHGEIKDKLTLDELRDIDKIVQRAETRNG